MIIRWLKGYIMPYPERLQFVIDAARKGERELPQIILQCSTNYLIAMEPPGTFLDWCLLTTLWICFQPPELS